MKLIYPRENLQKSIPLMALMAAINIIVSEIASLTLVGSIFLILCLPLTSCVVELCCKDRYFPIYAISTFGLSIALTFWNIETVFFYILPSIVSGYIFGLLTKKKIPSILIIFLATLAQIAISYLNIPLINFIFQVDMISVFKTAFNVNEIQGIDIIIPTFILLISLMQISLSYLICSQELQRFGINNNENSLLDFAASILGIIFGCLIWGSYFFNLKLSYLFLTGSFFFACYSFGLMIKNKYYWYLICVAVVILLNVFLYAGVQSHLKQHSQLLLISFSSICVCILSCLFSLLHKKKEKIK